MKRLLCIAALLAATGCQWMGRQADALGEHMPVIGDRCEHWQCVTSSGQAMSEEIKKEKALAQQPADNRPPAVPQNTPADQHHMITAAPQ